MMRRSLVACLCTMLSLFAALPAKADDGCPAGQFPQSLDNKCTPVSDHNSLPLDDESPMRFEGIQVSAMIIWVQATGVITKDTPSEFQKFLQSYDAKLTKQISLHSPGGDLMAGLTLGK